VIPSWASEYVGIPWVPKGRDRSGLDCWGLLRLVMAERYGVPLPAFTDADPAEREEIAALLIGNIPKTGWTLIDPPAREGDGVVFRLLGGPWHVGVALDAETFLHASEGVGSVAMERFDSYRWARRIWGIYRHSAQMVTA
jgi:cell wall-associated NlpC family hydrolase